MQNDNYGKIFKSINMFEDFFREKDFIKKILFPVEYFRLSEKQYNALCDALHLLKLPTIVYEVVTEDGNRVIVHDFQAGAYEQYTKNSNSILENQLYSDSLTWGIGISHEDHAILGCTKTFYDVFQSFYSQTDRDAFEKYWKNNQAEYGSDLNWFNELMKITV